MKCAAAQVGELFHKVYELIDFDLGKPERDTPETRAELMEVITKCLHSYAISEEHWNDDLTTRFSKRCAHPWVVHWLGFVFATSQETIAWTNCSLISRWPVVTVLKMQSTAPLSMAAITDSLSLRYTGGDDEIMRKAHVCRSADDFLGYRKLPGL